MTLERVIQEAEKLRPNTMYDDWDYLDAVNRIEAEVAEHMRRHGVWTPQLEGPDKLVPVDPDWTAYTDDMDRAEVTMLLPDAYSDIYILYLTAMMDFGNAEYDRYNNEMGNAQSRLREWKAEYRREHTPLPRSGRREHLV